MLSRSHFIATDPNASADGRRVGVLRLAKRLEAYAEPGEFLRAVPGELHTLFAGYSVALVLWEEWGVGSWFAVDGNGNSIPPTREMLSSLKASSSHLRGHRSSLLHPSEDPEVPLSGLAEFFQGLENPSLHVFPLNSASDCLGALCIAGPESDLRAEPEMHILAHVADIVALALDDRLVRAQLDHERTKLKLILDLNNSVVANLELRDVLRSISPSIRNVMRLDTVALILPDAESKHLRLYALDSPERKGFIHEDMVGPLDGSISGQVFRSGRAWLGDVAELQRSSFDHGIAAGEGVQTLCMLPLIRCDRVLGVLCLARRQKDAFTDTDINFLSQLAGQIAIAIDNALAYRQITELSERLTQEKLYLEDELRCEMNFEEIVGTSAALKRVLRQIEAVAPTNATVLIHGETGTGKELIARAVHKLSERRSKAFVKLNCAAIPTGLLESELFGHEKGAFTGAIAQRIGRFELASQGTIFLDEVGEIPLDLQPKLLRVLQEREFERLGSSRTLHSDGRLIAATNRDLGAMVRDQTFRSDLFYRLNVFPIHVPALRDRTEDIPFLVRHFAQHFARNTGKQIDTISSETMRVLVRYPWPGNIREMQNVIERAVILAKGHVLQVPVSDLKSHSGEVGNFTANGLATLEEVERRHILSVLEQSNWVFAGPNGAAARLGLKRPTLQFRMQKLGITRPRGNFSPPRNQSPPSN
jgi:formate hydrogenlyase transcriptional activator